VKAPPKRPPAASQVAHWITFKEDQRLEWQKKYLTQLCEGDQEIQEANELILEFTIMLRERKGERFGAWLEKVEQQGISELRNGPVFVLTHHAPDDEEDATITFLSGDIRSAVATGLRAAEGKNLLIIGASLARQCIEKLLPYSFFSPLKIHWTPYLS
jgi:hypothetical protein